MSNFVIETDWKKRRDYFLKLKRESEAAGLLEQARRFEQAAEEPFLYLLPGETQ
jgi:hypothetical protein